MELADKILELRKKHQYSQEQLGEKVGVTRQTISNWELNETTPNTKQLISLSKALETSIDELVSNDFQSIVVQKVDMIETEVEKNSGLLKVVIILAVVVIILILVLISAV